MRLEKGHVALVVTDPQNDFLSPKGIAWGVVGEGVKENHTVENIETLPAHREIKRCAGIRQPSLLLPAGSQVEVLERSGSLEPGFDVVVVTDATAAAKLPGFDGYEAAYVNFRLMASDVWSTAQTAPNLPNTGGAAR